MPSLYSLTSRADPSGPTNPIYIAGLCVIGAIILGLGIWLLIRLQRRRATEKREEIRHAAFLSNSQFQSHGFSPVQMDASVVLPDRMLELPQKLSTTNYATNYHRQSCTFPKPFSFALSAGSPARSPSRGPISARQSVMSGSSYRGRFSVPSTNSSVDSNLTSGTIRKVRQTFDPVLPDELLISRVGEQLTLVQSFDDGWFLVGREHSPFASTVNSLLKQNMSPESDVEFGVVPARCFIKQALGLRTGRPIRSTSLGITVQLSVPELSSREDIVSWSNF